MTATVGQMQGYATQVADQFGVPSNLFLNIIQAESGWNPSAQSGAGAIGLGQLMPGTAANLGVNPHDWQQNLRGSAQYLRQLYNQFGDWTSAVAAYHAGPGNVQKGNIGPATQKYLDKLFPNGFSSWFKDQQKITNDAYAKAGGVTNPLDWTQALANFFSFNTGVRILAAVMGVIFVIAAVFVLISGNKTVQQVVSNAAIAA